ncbi:MAG: hypothetical protein HQ553_11525, partial [Chloroflexi bacterium]|nr:hypothetical protein [Chloroflexota bacterium]
MKGARGLIKGKMPDHKTLSVVIVFILLATLLLSACVGEGAQSNRVITDEDDWRYGNDSRQNGTSGTPTSSATIGKVDDWQYNNGNVHPVTPPTPPTPPTPQTHPTLPTPQT